MKSQGMTNEMEQTMGAFKLVDEYRSRGMRLGEACAHASVDARYPGGHEALSRNYCRRDAVADFLDEMIADRTAKNSDFPAMMKAAARPE